MVVGAGFAGLAVVKGLAKAPVRVTLVDRRVYNTFQPLLYQVATGGLNPGDVTYFLRGLRLKQKNVRVVHEHLVGIDHEARRIRLLNDEWVDYDYLVVANGVTANFFGTPGAKENSFPMYSRSQAMKIRDTLFIRLEKAAANPGRTRACGSSSSAAARRASRSPGRSRSSAPRACDPRTRRSTATRSR